MIPHHESAIAMARIAEKRGESEFVRGLAADIVRTQDSEIRTLRREDEGLEAAGVDVGSLEMSHDMMGMSSDPAMLETAKPFDAKFLEMMIPHHEGAVTMAKIELEKGKDAELKAIVGAQEREIREMRQMREHLGS